MSKSKIRIAKKFSIKGRVQGVGFRYFTELHASELGILGYVKNCGDGSVEVFAIGSASAVDRLKTHLAEGPRSARVTSIDESDEPVDTRYKRFMIESSW